jgi:chondroitin sulfate proteoglycan 4
LNGPWQEKRFRFTYRVPASNSLAVNTYAGKVTPEDRVCRSEGQCSTASVVNSQEAQDDDWTEWSKCSRECGGGLQIRVKSCHPSDPDCLGSSTIAQRVCNSQPCPGDWGCWSTWTPCDRYNKKRRSRVCIASGGVVSGQASPACPAGSSFEEIDCDGWGPWGEWKDDCDASPDSTRVRTRACKAEECTGSDREIRACDGSAVPAVSVSGAMPVNVVVGACICGFIFGAAVGAGLVYYYLRYRKPGGAHGGSPHYVSAKSQNLYVSLPMLDLKHKHLSSNQSDCGTLRSTSTLRSKAGGSSIYSSAKAGSEYETATIKRSHSHRNSSLIAGAMRADLDSDQLFT